MHQGEAKPASAGLLTLPRELRDKIYGYLLRIDRFDALWGIGLEMSILRVSRTLHREASETLYKENPLVCITIEPSLLRNIPGWVSRLWDRFRDQMTCYARMTTVTVAKMILQKPSQSGPGDDPVLFPISPPAISRPCRLPTCPNKHPKTNLLVHLVSPKQGKVITAHHEYLLDCFREARDFEGVTIMDTQRDTSHTQLAALMMSPLEKCRDIVDASTYRDRALQKRKLGRLDEAQCDYKDGQHCLWWYISTGRSLGLSDHSENEEKIGNLFIELGFSLAFLSIHLGHLDDAIELILELTAPWLSSAGSGNAGAA